MAKHRLLIDFDLLSRYRLRIRCMTFSASMCRWWQLFTMFLNLERHPSSSYSSRYMSFFFKWNPHHSSIFQAHFLRSSWEKTYTARAQCPASLPLRQGETHGTRKRRSPEGDDPLNVREITWRFVASGHFSGHFSLWQLWRLKKSPCLHRYQVNHGKSSK